MMVSSFCAAHGSTCRDYSALDATRSGELRQGVLVFKEEIFKQFFDGSPYDLLLHPNRAADIAFINFFAID
jgi:hypothetical protein